MSEKPDFIKRLEAETEELQDKIEKLLVFMQTDKFTSMSEKQQVLLTMQANTMTTYLGLLGLRLEDLGY